MTLGKRCPSSSEPLSLSSGTTLTAAGLRANTRACSLVQALRAIEPELCPGPKTTSSHLLQGHTGEININIEGYVEVVGEDIQRDMRDDFADLSVR
jgi:hypothetical protein